MLSQWPRWIIHVVSGGVSVSLSVGFSADPQRSRKQVQGKKDDE